MSRNRSKRHIHKYYKAKVAGDLVWACALPDCNHHMPPHMTSLVEGKSSLCWECGGELVLDPEAYKMDRPTCISCRSGISVDDLNGEDVSIRLKNLLKEM
jgi:hypothetical protein